MRLSWIAIKLLKLVFNGDIVEATRLSVVFFRQLKFGPSVRRWRPSTTSSLISHQGEPRREELGVFIHLHYPEFVKQTHDVVLLYSTLYPNVKFHFSVSREDVHKKLIELVSPLDNVAKIVLAANKGRNFGPLLTHFEKELESFQFAIHLHSKKSVHSDPNFAANWSSLLWESLLLDPVIMMGFLNRMRVDEGIKLAYPVDLDLLPPDAYSWAQCLPFVPSEFWGSIKTRGLDKGRILFPAGGMFISRTEIYGDWLYRKKWSANDFPEEEGQLDRTVHHAVERLIGLYDFPDCDNSHLFYFPKFRCYSTDRSFFTIGEKKAQR